MADNDDLTGLFPDPPPPDGDRRSKAIEAALRRFDEANEQPVGDDRTSLPATQAAPNRAKFAVLASAALVMLVTVPLLMTQRFGPDSMLQEPQPSATERSVSVDLAESQPLLAEAPLAEEPHPAPAEAVIAPPAAAPPAENRADAAAPQVARATTEKAQPMAPQSPPARASMQEGSPDSADALVVTGSRVSRSVADQPARDRRLTPTKRQISAWQVCTVANERRNARTCAAQDRSDPAAAEIARGLEMSFRGHDRGALKAFDAALAAAPGSTTALLNRAILRQRLGNLEGANADFDRAIQANPADARIYYFRSLLRRKSGDGEGAGDDLATAISLAGGEVQQR